MHSNASRATAGRSLHPLGLQWLTGWRRPRLAWLAWLGLGAALARGQEVPTLAEVKERFQTDPAGLRRETREPGSVRFRSAEAQLKNENDRLADQVVALLATLAERQRTQDQLKASLRREETRDACAEADRQWFKEHAYACMRRVEALQDVFKNQVLEESTSCYVGAALCDRVASYRVEANTLLANLADAVPGRGEDGKTVAAASIKFARLVAMPIANPRQIAFVVLRREAVADATQTRYVVIDAAVPEQVTEQAMAGEWRLYQWELQTVLRARTGDYLAIVFSEPVQIACDYTGHGRFAVLRVPEEKAVASGDGFAFGQFETVTKANALGLDEAASCSMGFLGWTTAEE